MALEQMLIDTQKLMNLHKDFLTIIVHVANMYCTYSSSYQSSCDVNNNCNEVNPYLREYILLQVLIHFQFLI